MANDLESRRGSPRPTGPCPAGPRPRWALPVACRRRPLSRARWFCPARGALPCFLHYLELGEGPKPQAAQKRHATRTRGQAAGAGATGKRWGHAARGAEG